VVDDFWLIVDFDEVTDEVGLWRRGWRGETEQADNPTMGRCSSDSALTAERFLFLCSALSQPSDFQSLVDKGLQQIGMTGV
jgi:hypothetical protein